MTSDRLPGTAKSENEQKGNADYTVISAVFRQIGDQ